MENSEFDSIILKKKREKVIRTIVLACQFCNLTVPKINFDGCPMEGLNGPELAHYHSGGDKICISERQLKMQNEHELEETSIHEVIHHLGLKHGSAEEHVKFKQIKNYVMSRAWRPPDGAVYVNGDDKEPISTNTVKFKSESKKDDSRKQVNENFESEIRILIHQLEEAISNDERIRIINEIETLRSKYGGKFKIRDEDRKALERLDFEDKEVIDRILTGNPFSDEEWEKIINKVYEGKENQYGFGDQYGENRWNMKKEGLLGKSKKRFGINN